MKATYCAVNGEGREIFKDPKTDSGFKKSAKGLLKVIKTDGKYKLEDQVTQAEEYKSEMLTVLKDGIEYNTMSLAEIREELKSSNK